MAKNEQEPTAPLVAMTQEQLAALIANLQPQPQAGPMGGDAKAFAEALAEAIEDREMKWRPHELKRSPQVSVYSYPEGELARPKPKLKFHVYLGSYPLGDPGDNRTLTPAEVEALNTLTPGFYRIRKMDRSEHVIEIRGQVNAKQELERVWILLPDGDAQKNTYPPLDELPKQCIEANRTRNPLIAV